MSAGALLKAVMTYNGTDIRRNNHLLKVYGYAKMIGELEALAPDLQETIETAAIVHDIGIKLSEEKYGSCAGPYQEKEGAIEARKLLSQFDLTPERLERVVFLVGHHHTYQVIDGIDFQVLVEADFIVNIDEGKMEKSAIKSVKEKYFKTPSGRQLLETLYGV
jgi:hypothetical protein